MRVLFAVLIALIADRASAQDARQFADAPPGALSCAGCHGAGSVLSLDDLSVSEIETAMTDFRDGSRTATLMNRLAAGFTDAEISQIAAWISDEEASQ
jgi:cytochrome c553